MTKELSKSGSGRDLKKLKTSPTTSTSTSSTSTDDQQQQTSSKSFLKLFLSSNKRKSSKDKPEKLLSKSPSSPIDDELLASAMDSLYGPSTPNRHSLKTGGNKSFMHLKHQHSRNISIHSFDDSITPLNLPIKNIEDELSTRVRMASHTSKHLLSKSGSLYVKLIEWKHYALMDVKVDEFGGLTISDSQQQYFHARIQPTQHFTVNHMGRLPVVVTKEPAIKKSITANKKTKTSGSPKNISSDGEKREMKLSHVFCFVIVDFNMNASDEKINSMLFSDDESEKINSILFACDTNWTEEFKDWNELFELLLLRNMSLINVPAKTMFRQNELRKRMIMEEMHLVKNSGINDVIDMSQLMNMYEESIQ